MQYTLLAPADGGRADLRGPGWGRWRGVWNARRRLEGRNGAWETVEDGSPTARWPTLGQAVDDLWRTRTIRDRMPWAVGWLGYEACAKMKTMDEIKDIPVVILSAKGQESEIQTGLNAGAYEYILKPFAPDELIQRVRDIVSSLPQKS